MRNGYGSEKIKILQSGLKNCDCKRAQIKFTNRGKRFVTYLLNTQKRVAKIVTLFCYLKLAQKKQESKFILIKCSPENIFGYSNNIYIKGIQMTKSSMPIIENKIRIGTAFRKLKLTFALFNQSISSKFRVCCVTYLSFLV